MTTVDRGAEGAPHGGTTQEGIPLVEAEPAAVGLLAGDPLMLGLPTFIVGSYALGLALIGAQVPVGSFGAALAIVLAATSIGLFISAIWAIAVGQSAVASILGIFGGFWASLVVLVVAVDHNWFAFATPAAGAVPASNISVGAIEMFLITWLIIVGVYTLAMLRLPSAYTLILVLICLALIFVLLGVSGASTSDLKTGGIFTIAFASVGVYVFMGQAAVATGGRPLPLGRPIIKG
jgi:succinate-acetate transporter protein